MLDNRSPIPLYYQLKATIEERIASGVWKPGDRVPSEYELGEQFHVSRTTVRQALGELVNQGLLARLQGRGTYVSQPRIQQRLTQLTGFTQDMHARGQRSGSQVLQFEAIAATTAIARSLQLPADEPVILLKRLRIADAVPMAVETAYLSYRRCEALLQEDLSSQSLYSTLAQKCSIVPSYARQSLEAMACPKAEAHLLGVAKGSPVLHIFRTTYDQNSTPFEFVESYYRGDRYIFNAELSGLSYNSLLPSDAG